jgi:signal transduction histidine kinase
VKHLQPFDKLLLAVLVPLWAACFALSLISVIRETALSSIYVSAPVDAGDYPTLIGFWPHLEVMQSGLEAGDRLVRLGDADLRGVGPLRFWLLVPAEMGMAREADIMIERAGRQEKASLVLGSNQIVWPLLAPSFAFAVTAVILLLRAPPSAMVQASFRSQMCVAIACASIFAGSRVVTSTSLAVGFLSATLLGPLVLRALLLFPHSIEPAGFWARKAPWFLSVLGLLHISRLYGAPLPPSLANPGFFAGILALCIALLVATTHTYRRTDAIGRRQFRWLLFGMYCTMVPGTVVAAVTAMDPRFLREYLLAGSALVLIPLSLLIAIARYNLFDIDRLISATTSYTIVLVLAVAGGLAFIPQLAGAASRAIGLNSWWGQVLLAIVFATLVVPARRRIAPQIDRLFFPDRYGLAHGIKELLADLSRCERLEELALRTGDRLYAVLRPETCVIYVRTEQAFSPLVVRGRAVPADIPAGGPFASALEASEGAVELTRLTGQRGTLQLAAEERQALENLRATVLLPIQRRRALVGFVCLGHKQSGDVYTPTDLALLAAVTDKMSTELLRFDEAALASIGEALSRVLHDFKNPLTAALGYAEIMSTVQTQEEREEYARLIQKQFMLMDEMTRDVLAYARGESYLLIRPVHVTRFLGDLSAQLEPELSRHGVRLTIEPEFHGIAWFDEAKLIRAIYNLARNAVEAMPDGGVFRIASRVGDAHLILEFSDTGKGIPTEILERLFIPFVTAGKAEGTGLGLATVKNVVDEHHGTINVHSTPGAGTTFTISLPLERPDEAKGTGQRLSSSVPRS